MHDLGYRTRSGVDRGQRAARKNAKCTLPTGTVGGLLVDCKRNGAEPLVIDSPAKTERKWRRTGQVCSPLPAGLLTVRQQSHQRACSGACKPARTCTTQQISQANDTRTVAFISLGMNTYWLPFSLSRINSSYMFSRVNAPSSSRLADGSLQQDPRSLEPRPLVGSAQILHPPGPIETQAGT